MSETVPFGDAQARLSALADRVEAGNERIVVTRNGRPSFVLVSPDELDALEDAHAGFHGLGLTGSVRRVRRSSAGRRGVLGPAAG